MKDIISVYNGSMNKGCWLRLLMLASRMAEEGNRVYLVVPSSFVIPEQQNIVKVPFPREESRYHLGGISKILAAIVAAYKAIKLSRRASNPLWVVFDTHNAMSFLAKNLTRGEKILLIRGEARFQGKYNEPYFYGVFIRLLNRQIKRIADIIIYNNKASQSHGERTLGQKHPPSFTVPNNTRFSLLEHVRAKHTPFTIGYCGQFAKRKNVELLIKAFTLLERGPYKLVLKGDWNKYSWVKPYLSKQNYPHIEFQPWSKDIEPFYQSIDLFVLPSIFDDFSNAALDAIGHGIPVILSKTGGSPEMVNHNSHFLFELNQGPSGLAAKIKHIRHHYNASRNEIKEISKQYRFDWGQEVASIIMGETDTSPKNSRDTASYNNTDKTI
ncbi:glycosyltransferase family 4 protein [Billgrantia sp. LNSP4103-1]|uniref:glycosyltransferase family 4 protein n=1 Tax=Billgrantia sp. LNSP4103-1 TaxID=3410266 RepID=UPI00403F31AC